MICVEQAVSAELGQLNSSPGFDLVQSGFESRIICGVAPRLQHPGHGLVDGDPF